MPREHGILSGRHRGEGYREVPRRTGCCLGNDQGTRSRAGDKSAGVLSEHPLPKDPGTLPSIAETRRSRKDINPRAREPSSLLIGDLPVQGDGVRGRVGPLRVSPWLFSRRSTPVAGIGRRDCQPGSALRITGGAAGCFLHGAARRPAQKHERRRASHGDKSHDEGKDQLAHVRVLLPGLLSMLYRVFRATWRGRSLRTCASLRRVENIPPGDAEPQGVMACLSVGGRHGTSPYPCPYHGELRWHVARFLWRNEVEECSDERRDE